MIIPALLRFHRRCTRMISEFVSRYNVKKLVHLCQVSQTTFHQWSLKSGFKTSTYKSTASLLANKRKLELTELFFENQRYILRTLRYNTFLTNVKNV